MKAELFPKWMTKSKVVVEKVYQVKATLKDLKINTICETVKCPNLGECFSKPTAAFMILGEVCSRNCLFCFFDKGKPRGIDFDEPKKIAHAAQILGLKHIVITSVARDDLADLGALHFARTIYELRKVIPNSTIEVLVHDFLANTKAIRTILYCAPHIFNHNINTVPRIYEKVQSKANYQKSLKVLKTAKRIKPDLTTKSGLMVGLGETEQEVLNVIKDLREVKCDILNIGQYLQPTRYNIPVKTFVTPETFLKYKNMGLEMGFKYVESAPFVRSSYNAHLFIDNLKPTQTRNIKDGTVSSYQKTSSIRF